MWQPDEEYVTHKFISFLAPFTGMTRVNVWVLALKLAMKNR
jgi:hypothetical protein